MDARYQIRAFANIDLIFFTPFNPLWYLSLDFVLIHVLQTPPRDDVLALLLTFGSTITWYGALHPTSSVPCPAHTRNSAARLFASAEMIRNIALTWP